MRVKLLDRKREFEYNIEMRTDADTTIGVQEKKTADMHFKTDNMM